MLPCLTHLETEMPASSNRRCGQISDARFEDGITFLYLQQCSREVTEECCIVLVDVCLYGVPVIFV